MATQPSYFPPDSVVDSSMAVRWGVNYDKSAETTTPDFAYLDGYDAEPPFDVYYARFEAPGDGSYGFARFGFPATTLGPRVDIDAIRLWVGVTYSKDGPGPAPDQLLGYVKLRGNGVSLDVLIHNADGSLTPQTSGGTYMPAPGGWPLYTMEILPGAFTGTQFSDYLDAIEGGTAEVELSYQYVAGTAPGSAFPSSAFIEAFHMVMLTSDAPAAITPVVPHHGETVHRYVAAPGATETALLLKGVDGDEPWAEIHHGAYAIPPARTGSGERNISGVMQFAAPAECWVRIFAEWYTWSGTELVVGARDRLGPPAKFGEGVAPADFQSEWTEVEIYAKADAAASHWRPRLVFSPEKPETGGDWDPLPGGTEVFIDCIYIPDNGLSLSDNDQPYLDGDQPYGVWEGTERYSTSIFGEKPPPPDVILGESIVIPTEEA